MGGRQTESGLLGILCLLLAGSSGIRECSAAVLASESFNYEQADGSLISGAAGGTGWSGAWGNTGLDFYRTAGMTFPGLTTSGGSIETRSFSATDFRNLNASYGTDGTTLWLRFLIQRDNTDTEGNSGYAGLSLFDNGSEQLFIGKRNGVSTWGLEQAGGGASANSTVSINDPGAAMMLVRLSFLPGAETIDLWALNSEAPEDELDLGAASASISATDFDFNRIRIGSGSTVYNVDEIFLASSYEDLFATSVPEPTTLVLMMGAGLVLTRLRQRVGQSVAEPRVGFRD